MVDCIREDFGESAVEAAEKHPKQPRIVDGAPASSFATSFYVKSAADGDLSTSDSLCGATLVHKDIIVSAAHCYGTVSQ